MDSLHPVLLQLTQAWQTDTIGNCGAHLELVVDDERDAAEVANSSSLTEAIHIHGERVGWLKIANTGALHLQTRLKADAQIVSTLLQQEYEIEKMTSELIDQQDQLMALHHLARATRLQSDFGQTLVALAGVAARLLKTEGAFMQLRVAEQEPYFAVYPQEAWAKSLWHKLLQNFDTTSSQKQWLLQHPDPALKTLGVPIRNLLMKKIRVRTGVSFVLGAVNKLNGDFQTPDIKLLSTIAEPAGANLENALL